MTNEETQQSTALLHVVPDKGVAWRDGHNKVHKTEHPAAEFVERVLPENVSNVRVVGMPFNVPLLCELWKRRGEKGTPATIQIGGPQIVDYDPRVSPEKVFRSMDGCRWPASVGGWHLMTDLDARQYGVLRFIYESPELLFNNLFTDNGQLTDEGMDVARQHPAYPAFAFSPWTYWPAALLFLGETLDPRWTINPANPDSWTSRFRYVSLDRAPVSKMRKAMKLSKDKPAEKALWRLRLLTLAWSGTTDPRVVGAITARGPEAFLFRKFSSIGMAAKDGNWRGFAEATKKFYEFLSLVWLDQLVTSRQFVPEYFFNSQDEIDAWNIFYEPFQASL